MNNTSTNYISFEFNSNYQPCTFYNNNVNFYPQSKLVEELVNYLGDLIAIYKKKPLSCSKTSKIILQ